MIGLPRGVVHLVPYTNEWIRLFEAEKARLQAAIGKHVLDIQHVGSTAIPGLNEVGSRDWENQVLFRDYLVGHPQLAKEYAALKRDLAERHPMDREAYLEGKARFVEQVLEMARSER